MQLPIFTVNTTEKLFPFLLEMMLRGNIISSKKQPSKCQANVFSTLSCVFQRLQRAHKEGACFSNQPKPVSVDGYTSPAHCDGSAPAALLTGGLSDKLEEWLCCPAVQVYSSICHTAPCQRSRDGLTFVNDVVPYVCFH